MLTGTAPDNIHTRWHHETPPCDPTPSLNHAIGYVARPKSSSKPDDAIGRVDGSKSSSKPHDAIGRVDGSKPSSKPYDAIGHVDGPKLSSKLDDATEHVVRPKSSSRLDDAIDHVDRPKSSSKLDHAIVRVEARSALVGMGWKPAVARSAIDAAASRVGRDAPLEAWVREALRHCPLPRT